MKKPIIVFDMTYFMALGELSDQESVYQRIVKNKPKLIRSGVEILSNISLDSRVITIDSYLDIQYAPYDENIGKTNWLSPIDQQIFWSYPHNLPIDKAFDKFSELHYNTSRVKAFRQGFPSDTLLKESDLYFEFNASVYESLAAPLKKRILGDNLVPYHYIQNKIEPMDYSVAQQIMEKNTNFGLNFYDRV